MRVFIYRIVFVITRLAVAIFRHVAAAGAKPPNFAVVGQGAVVEFVAVGAAAFGAS